MPDIFEIIHQAGEGKDAPLNFSLGIRIKIGNYETICPVTEFLSCDDLKSEIGSFENELAGILKKLGSLENGNNTQTVSGMDEDATPEELWGILSKIPDNPALIEQFNSLNEHKRRELADHIFANCNMFTGKGAFFSAHYIQESALLLL